MPTHFDTFEPSLPYFSGRVQYNPAYLCLLINQTGSRSFRDGLQTCGSELDHDRIRNTVYDLGVVLLTVVDSVVWFDLSPRPFNHRSTICGDTRRDSETPELPNRRSSETVHGICTNPTKGSAPRIWEMQIRAPLGRAPCHPAQPHLLNDDQSCEFTERTSSCKNPRQHSIVR